MLFFYIPITDFRFEKYESLKLSLKLKTCHPFCDRAVVADGFSSAKIAIINDGSFKDILYFMPDALIMEFVR